MKKQLLSIIVLLTCSEISAQVGINSTTPKATLDIAAKTSNGSTPEGIIAPRLTGDQIKAADAQYTAAQQGTIIYATAAVTTASVKTANLTAPGYYYYDGSLWQKIGNTYTGSTSIALNGSSFERTALTGDVTAAANNNSTTISNNAVTSAKILDGDIANADLGTGVGGIYKGSGSLSGATTVTQNANTLAFTSTATNGFSVDGTSLSVDAANNRVGIGTSGPTEKLHVNGNARIQGNVYDGNNSPGYNGQIISSDGTKITWINSPSITPTVIGILSATGGGDISACSAGYNTGSYIDLPPGKWSVNGSFLIYVGGSLNHMAGDKAWVRARLSTSSTALVAPTYITTGNQFSGLVNSEFGMCIGTILINNNTAAIQRLYVWRDSVQVYGGTCPILSGFASSGAGENILIAYPIN